MPTSTASIVNTRNVITSEYNGRDATRMPRFPARIVCLTEETTETLYRLGAGDRVVGVSGYTARPPEARTKPKVSAFLNARFDKIAALEPDLVLAFSDLQADIARELIRRGYPVVTFNQRSVAEILQMIRMLGGMIGLADRADALAAELESDLNAVGTSAARFERRPRVFFEEWDDPLISGIRWVEELVEIAGGDPIFPHLRSAALGRDRIVTPDAVRDAAPDVILASWCGKKVRKATIASRAGWAEVPAIANGHVYEIKSTYILQPGPAALTEGLRQVHWLIAHSLGVAVDQRLAPEERVDPDAVSLAGSSRPPIGHPAPASPRSGHG
jgi:iron complex transport system substrate-binding protein